MRCPPGLADQRGGLLGDGKVRFDQDVEVAVINPNFPLSRLVDAFDQVVEPFDRGNYMTT